MARLRQLWRWLYAEPHRDQLLDYYSRSVGTVDLYWFNEAKWAYARVAELLKAEIARRETRP